MVHFHEDGRLEGLCLKTSPYSEDVLLPEDEKTWRCPECVREVEGRSGPKHTL